jgi:hypothetical protein
VGVGTLWSYLDEESRIRGIRQCSSRSNLINSTVIKLFITSVPDLDHEDPYAFGPPGSATLLINHSLFNLDIFTFNY